MIDRILHLLLFSKDSEYEMLINVQATICVSRQLIGTAYYDGCFTHRVAISRA
jgi:hypothetical protein